MTNLNTVHILTPSTADVVIQTLPAHLPVRTTQGVCRYCGKHLVAVGHARKNGKNHSDWVTREYHKKCYPKALQEQQFQPYQDNILQEQLRQEREQRLIQMRNHMKAYYQQRKNQGWRKVNGKWVVDASTQTVSPR